MILTDREIQIAIQTEQIVVTPQPKQDAYSSTSLDLTLGDKFVTWEPIRGMVLDLAAEEYGYNELKRLQKTHSGSFDLNPNTFVLAWTKEYVELRETARMAARVEGKSSLARLGVCVHLTAPTIHAGFKGQIQLEMYNFGSFKINLTAGLRICQLIFEQTLGTPEKGYRGMFAGQSS